MSQLHALIVYSPGHGHRTLPGVAVEAAHWEACLVASGLAEDGLVHVISGNLVAGARAAVAAVSPGDVVTLVVVGHGAGARSGRGVLAEDGTVVPLVDLVASLPGGVSVRWLLDLCGVSGVHRSAADVGCGLGADSVVVAACGLGEVAEQRRIQGEWRSAFSWAAQRVLEQRGGVSAESLARHAGAMLGALGVDALPVVAGPAALCAEPLGGLVEAPRLAMEILGGNTIVILDSSNNLLMMLRALANNTRVRVRKKAGVTSADFTDEISVQWRDPTQAELNQLEAGWGCPNELFSSASSFPVLGERYKSADRDAWLVFSNRGLTKIVWMAAQSALTNNRLPTPSATNETFNRISSTPSAPAGGWYRAVDEQ